MALVNTDKAVQQFSGFTKLPVLRQLGLMAGLAASVALGVAVVNWSQSPDFMPVYGGLSSQDAAEVIQVLEQSGVKYRLDGSTVSIPAESVHEMRLKLASQGVPRGDSGGGFELLDQEQPFGTSSFMEKARYNRALEGELSKSITTLASVQTARVHLAVPKRSVFARSGSRASASVLVNLYPGRTLNESQTAGIVYLVASSVPNMQASDVTVVDQQGNLLTNSKGNSQLAVSTEQFRFIREVENTYTQRIVQLLTPMLGAERVSAQVNVDMDFTSLEKTREEFDPDKKVVRSEQVNEQARAGKTVAKGVPGALSNTPPTDQPEEEEEAVVEEELFAEEADGEVKPTINKSLQATRNYELNRTVSHIKETPGSIKRLSVAVLVDYMDTLDSNGKLQRIPLSQEELDRITLLVRDAVGFNEIRGDSVNVVNSSFRQEEMLIESLPEPSVLEKAMDNPQLVSWGKQLLGVLAVLFLIFGVLRPVLRNLAAAASVKPQALPAGGAPQALPEGMAEDQVTLSSDTQLRLPNAQKIDNYEQQLTMAKSMVKEDPKRVAQVVKGWLDEN